MQCDEGEKQKLQEKYAADKSPFSAVPNRALIRSRQWGDPPKTQALANSGLPNSVDKQLGIICVHHLSGIRYAAVIRPSTTTAYSTHRWSHAANACAEGASVADD